MSATSETPSTAITSPTSATSSVAPTSASSTPQSSAVDATSSATPTPTPTQTDSATSVSLPPGTVTNTTTVATASATAEAANAPKSFLQNKALSVGVITAASLVGLVLIIAIATWAIRKRKHERLHRDILDFSTADLVDHAEKGAGAGGVNGTGSIGGTSSAGHGSSSSHGALAQPQMQPRGMYENVGYPSLPAYAPNPMARAANPYPAQSAYNDRGYAFPSQEQNNTYANWGYRYGNGQQQQTQFDQAYAGVDDAYGGLAYNDPQPMAGVGAGAQSQGPQRRPSAHRKPPPQLHIPPANPIAEAIATNSPISSVSLTKPALQPAGGMVGAQPGRRTSLLNSPVAENVENDVPRERKDTLTHVELLDPTAPKMPASSPRLPDEFGVSSPPVTKDSPVEQPVRRLVVSPSYEEHDILCIND